MCQSAWQVFVSVFCHHSKQNSVFIYSSVTLSDVIFFIQCAATANDALPFFHVVPWVTALSNPGVNKVLKLFSVIDRKLGGGSLLFVLWGSESGGKKNARLTDLSAC